MKILIPNRIKLVKEKDKVLFEYDRGEYLILTTSYLRFKSPSAENKYRKNISENLFSKVKCLKIEKVGNYAIRLIFDDNHNTGIFSWEYITQIGLEFQKSSTP